MRKPRVICGIDIGTTKVACAIGTSDPTGEPWILGVGQIATRSAKRGIVTDLAGVTQAAARACEAAEDQAETPVDRTVVNLSGTHLVGLHSRAAIELEDAEGEITRRDVDRVVGQAKAITVPYDRQIIHAIPQSFTIDGTDGIRSPVGMFGKRLETELFIVTGLATMIQNVRKSVEGAGLDAVDLIVAGMATTQAVLTEQERELGTVLIDVGGSVTEVAMFLDGIARQLWILPTGGDRLTEALQTTLRIPFQAAEELKLRYGAASAEGVDPQAKVMITLEGASRSFVRHEVCVILREAWQGVVRELVERIEGHPLLPKMSSGIVLTGRSLLLEGAIEAAEPLFHMPIRMGITRGLRSTHADVYDPTYATAIGLVRYTLEQQGKDHPAMRRAGPLALFDRLQTILREYF